MSVSHFTKATVPYLACPDKWEDFICRIKRKSIGEGVWDYINPDLIEPTLLVKPTRPTFADAKQDATSASELDANDRWLLSILVSKYKELMCTYK